jgi:hypothetical protein
MITSSLVLMRQAADGDGPAINGRHHLCDMSSMRGTEKQRVKRWQHRFSRWNDAPREWESHEWLAVKRKSLRLARAEFNVKI